MIRAFLSHSSKDKENYVKNVANLLGRDQIIYDEFSFEEGEKSLDEILKGLDKTSIFVLLLSANALDSEWVKREIIEAKFRLNETHIDKIFPIIIDANVKHDDQRIPDWLRENYNLRPIRRAQVAARRIQNKLRELSWAKHPELKKRNTMFVGRNDKQEQFEERIHDFNKDKPTAIIASGLPGIGRRTFLNRALYKTNISENLHKPSSIILDGNVSIEDFILKLNDVGLIDLNGDVLSLADKSINEKIQIVHKIMDAAYQANEIFYLVDDGCLVNYQREISNWFSMVVNSYEKVGFPIFGIASKYKVGITNRPRNDKYYFIELNELNANERRRLFTQLLDLYKIKLSKKDFDDVADLLFGFPDQVMFAVDIIKEDNLTSFPDKLPVLREYSSDRAAALLKKYESNEIVLDFIRLLAQFEVISSDFIFSIVPEQEYYDLLESLASEHVVELIGGDGEIIRLNDIIRDYIKRNRLTLKNEFIQKIDQQVNKIIATDDIFERDSSEFIFSLKEALKNGVAVDSKLLIPSHYLRCMKDLYYNKGNLDRVVELADVILQKKDNLEIGVLQDIWYYLCLALARKKDNRMLKEVQNIKGEEHKFLLGYYYRLSGRYAEALEQFQKIVDAPYVGARAKREIVQVYVQLEEYEKALGYAKKNYEENRGNQFHTQAYFNCLINSELPENHQNQLLKLIANLKLINSEQSNEMADIAEAFYFAKVENNKVKALDKISDCVYKYPENHYPLFAMCDIALKFNDKPSLNQGFKMLQILIKDKHLSTRTLNRYRAYVLAFDGKEEEALRSIEQDLSRYPAESRQRIVDRIKEICTSHIHQLEGSN